MCSGRPRCRLPASSCSKTARTRLGSSRTTVRRSRPAASTAATSTRRPGRRCPAATAAGPSTARRASAGGAPRAGRTGPAGWPGQRGRRPRWPAVPTRRPAAAPLGGEMTGKADQRCLGRVVGSHRPARCDQAADGRDIDHRPVITGEQQRCHQTAQIQNRNEVHLNDRIQFVERLIFQRAVIADTCVVDQDVQPTEADLRPPQPPPAGVPAEAISAATATASS